MTMTVTQFVSICTFIGIILIAIVCIKEGYKKGYEKGLEDGRNETVEPGEDD